MAPFSLHSVIQAARRLPGASLLLFTFAGVAFLLPSLAQRLEFNRSAILCGELWRMVTCHWIHASSDHFFWDAVTFLLLSAQCEWYSRSRFLVTVLGSALFIPIVIWVVMPEIQFYRGLSGIDSALYILLSILFVRHGWGSKKLRWLMVSVMGCSFLCKVGYEFVTGTTLFVDSFHSHMLPIPFVHILGAAIVFLGGMIRIRKSWIHTLNGYLYSILGFILRRFLPGYGKWRHEKPGGNQPANY
jgi:rhomboid family GlyGly-CTERM serine protease